MASEMKPGIKEFFKGRDIFITGGSGNLNLILIIYLLYKTN